MVMENSQKMRLVKINLIKLVQCLKLLGMETTTEKVDNLFQELDLNKDGKIVKEEFLESMARWMKGYN
jgi:Ca2+-binding EF-hand superfamily protein